MEDFKQMINIIYEDNHLLVVEKPINVPVQADSSKDLDLLNILKNYLKNKYHKTSNVYLGLVHRLDRPVGGIMVFAKTSKCAKRLSQQIRDHQFQKIYNAIVLGNINKEGTYEDKLLKSNNKNIVTVSDKGKIAILNYKKIESNKNMSLVEINLQTGRSHQIRVQFSYHGYPLYGDQKYNKKAIKNAQIALFSKRITFYHPITKEQISFSLKNPSYYPWNIFTKNN